MNRLSFTKLCRATVGSFLLLFPSLCVIVVAHKRVFVSALFQLAEYRQRKAQSDGQKKQKKKKKKPESDAEEQGDDQSTVFSLSKTLRSGESVSHEQTYSIEVSRVHDRSARSALYTAAQAFEIRKSLFCSLRLYLFNHKYRNNCEIILLSYLSICCSLDVFFQGFRHK